MPLPASLRTLLNAPKYAARVSSTSSSVMVPAGLGGLPRDPPRAPLLRELFDRLATDSKAHGVGWGEWLTLSTATMFALNSPGSLKAMHAYVMQDQGELRPLAERVDRACLMREAGLKCLGLIGTPKTINNLAALRAMVDADEALAEAMPTEARRDIQPQQWAKVVQAGSDLFDDIYAKQSQKLRGVMAHSHPDLTPYILQCEYGPLFAPPPMFLGTSEPSWEVNRLRMSLVAIASLHAQGGVAPQVVSHIYGLLRARPSIEQIEGPSQRGLEFLTSEAGAEWAIRMINEICRVVDGSDDADRAPWPAHL
ncbi:hypothetical protein ACI68E_001825 [Malassezia pachydermatis]|uniref:Uncharacterized protein n=1 Tax=Malassezia pachydermatis TaxID=77020 RepID=A0A0M8MYZ5_9BASI|nr:hypothetical protein Malapachy_3001 [Malassezia pachydermatis]KOS16550.1 hypothetical protein Malapachy_3001 [Malassezia pachydermatis]